MLEAWGDTMLATALLVAAVLAVRKPFARRFGPGLTYALWAIPALRLVLPPLPFGDPAAVPVVAPAVPVDVVLIGMADTAHAIATPATAPDASWAFADALPPLFALWLAGALLVLARALVAHRRFKAKVLAGGVDLDPIGSIRLVMSDAVDGPVAFGLWRRFIAVPRDFFARYAADERALAIDHELSHHRHGDLWANAAALLLLAVQWFNPFAWRALPAFRFDQEAACDARVLTMAATGERRARTASYATAIAKTAVGPRLALAAPMASHDNLQERLTMLMQKDISRMRGLVGRLLVGGAALGVLAATATLVPAGTAKAQAQDVPAPPAPPAPPAVAIPEPPAPPAPPLPPEAIDGGHSMMLFTSDEDGDGAGEHRQVTRVVVRDGSDEGRASSEGHVEFRVPGSLSRTDILATLNEQGISGAQAEAIADKLEARRRETFRVAVAPLPPVPPSWAKRDAWSMTVAPCPNGEPGRRFVDRDDVDGDKHMRVLMLNCGGPGADKAKILSSLRSARDQLARGESGHGLSADMRDKVIGDLDRSIAGLEAGEK